MIEQVQDASIRLMDAEDHRKSALAAIGELSNSLPQKLENDHVHVRIYIACVEVHGETWVVQRSRRVKDVSCYRAGNKAFPPTLVCSIKQPRPETQTTHQKTRRGGNTLNSPPVLHR